MAFKKKGYFVEEHFRKENLIDKQNRFSGDEKIDIKDLNNDLLSKIIDNKNKKKLFIKNRVC